MTTKEYSILYQTPMIQAILNGTKNQTRRIVKDQIFGLLNPQIAPKKAGDIHWRYDWDSEKEIWDRHEIIIQQNCFCFEGEIERYINPCDTTKGTKLFLWQSSPRLCPYGQVGDYTWARETFQKLQTWEENGCQFYDLADKSLSYFFEYKATNESNWDGKWKPSIFMPQSACRIVRENIDIRVERVADISEEDAIGEGVELVNDSNCLWKDYELTDGTKRLSARSSYKSLWNSINNNPKLNKKTDTYIVYPFDKQSAAKWGNTYRNKPLIVVPNPWVWVVKFK